MNILHIYLVHLIYIRVLDTCEWLRVDLSICLPQLGIESRKGSQEFGRILQRLALTLRYLATGESQQSLSLSYRIGKSTVCQIVSETALAIYNSLKDSYTKTPLSKEKWLNISSAGFEDTWNFPHCIGAIDGIHSAYIEQRVEF